MSARFVYRIDDVAPEMNWRQFWRYVELFHRHHVTPLLGVVPDNQDPSLCVDAPRSDFWQVMRQLAHSGVVEISQHGYQHRYSTKEYGILGRKLGFAPDSEFVGLPYEHQLMKIRRGLRILEEQGLPTTVWMAPSHSFDRTTLRALRTVGFEALSDGIALYPFDLDGMIFVPQQLWAPKNVPLGVWTICLHINRPEESLFESIKGHLERGARVISFSEAMSHETSFSEGLGNAIFHQVYTLHILRHRMKKALRRTR